MIKSLVQCSHKIAQKHLVMGAMGNISLRDPDRREWAWIKRSGVWLERAKTGDFLRVNIAHPEPRIARKISKEINLHLGCYKVRPDINAAIHTHPVIATAVGTILAKSSQKKLRIGQKSGLKVTIIKYYQPGSRILAKAVKKAIKKADCVLMANHGLLSVGKSLQEAYNRTIKIEKSLNKFLMKKITCK